MRSSSSSSCRDIHFFGFQSSSVKMSLTGRCAGMILKGYADMIAAGAEVAYESSVFTATMGISAAFVDQLNLFEGEMHENVDNWLRRFWDDGRETAAMLQWENHDQGDLRLNAATSAFSEFGALAWITTEEAASMLNMTAADLTPESFKQVYLDAWVKTHLEEAAANNQNAQAELDIIEKVKKETTNIVVEDITKPAADSSEGESQAIDVDSSATTQDPSGTGRRMALVTLRLIAVTFIVFVI